jgi:glycolate oxidase FAD binding subunit
MAVICRIQNFLDFNMSDWVEKTSAQIQQAVASKQTLTIRGGSSKHFYGNTASGNVLSTLQNSGIIDYEPRELTITALSGTPLAEIESLLQQHRQMLPFEPPHFGTATWGGCIAAGLSGPRRPYAGAVRDAVLGVGVIDGRGQHLRFGGRVIKNVAGYDVSRLMVGSMGTLGVITEATCKLLPRPECESTVLLESGRNIAIQTMNMLAGQSLPISATAWRRGDDVLGQLLVRLSATESTVISAIKHIGGEVFEEATFWQDLKEQRLPEFTTRPLWRVSVPATTLASSAALEFPHTVMVEWGGALRWLAGDVPAEHVFSLAAHVGGHATLFRQADGVGVETEHVFPMQDPSIAALNQRIRNIFDPHQVFDAARVNQ